MLIKMTRQLFFMYQTDSQHAIVQRYQEKYKNINAELLKNPRLLDLIHVDLSRMRAQSGRETTYSSDTIFRMLLVKCIEMLDWRGTIIRIENDMFLRNFIGVGWGELPNHSFLCAANKFISPETWKAVNQELLQVAIGEGKVTGEKLRIDSTVYETNIHYPTDSHLLWDSYRVLVRTLREFQQLFPSIQLGHRFHDKKVKKLFSFISRNSSAKRKSMQRNIKGCYQKLITQVTRAQTAAADCVERAGGGTEERGPIATLKHFLPIISRVVHQTEMRINQGITLPAEEKVYSIFEEHTELIIRGKAGKEIEFGHMAMLGQTGEKFISYYEAMKKRKPDNSQVDNILETHKKQFERYPEQLAGDKGFYESMDRIKALEEKIEVVCIPKKGRRTAEEEAREHGLKFKALQKFRAGVEGSISALKRAFGMRRCTLRTFNSFASNLGCIVFCYNLVLMTLL